MSKIKVLQIITRLDKGGSAQVVLSIVTKLNKARFDLTLISGQIKEQDQEILNLLANENIAYICVPELKREINIINDVKALFKIYSFIKKQGFDIVHTNTSKAGILGRWAARLAGVKIIVHTPHGHIFYGYFGWFKTQLFICLEKRTALITDRIITLTEIGKQEHIKYRIATPDKFIPIYNGIEIEKFRRLNIDRVKARQNFNIPQDVAVIGTVTRLDPVKGNKYLIASFPEVIKVFPTLKAIIAGDGSEREALQSEVKKLGISENVIFLGECKDISQILCLFDIFVLSSLMEGLGICLLEAQAQGLPVIATKVGGISEVVKDGVTGILVPPRDSNGLAQAIIKLLKDKTLREDMAERAKDWINERFSVEVMVKKVSDLYEQLIEEKQKKHVN